MLKKVLLFVHRWLGVGLSALFLVWFPSAIGMMYWDYPSVTPADRLEHSPSLSADTVKLSPDEAILRAGLAQPSQLRLNTYDGRPVYRIRAGRETIVYADTGARQTAVSSDLMLRTAAAWTRQPANAATAEAMQDVDQWTLQLRAGPLWKYSWPNGEQAYVSERSGEVVQYTTRAMRIGAYLGPIPHWFYFTPLRRHGPAWTRVVVWTSGAGTVTAIIGIVLGIWMYSPSKRYRLSGGRTSIPYLGQKRWHMMLGLVFGIATVTWVFSGLLSMEPFPLSREPADASAADRIPQALRGSATLTAFAGEHPRDVLGKLAGLDVRDLEWTSFAGQPAYLATLAGGATRIIPVGGEPRLELDRQRIIDQVTAAAQPAGLQEVRLLTEYDRYYLDRRRGRPLPVLLFRVADPDQSRYYVDPKTGRLAGSYSERNWVARWIYHGLHSFDFPWLYNYRPAWDIVVIVFMLGGTALAVTSLVLAWRVLGRALRGAR